MRVRNNEQVAKQKTARANGLKAIEDSQSLRSRSWLWDTLEGLQGSSGRSPEVLRHSFGRSWNVSGGPRGSLRVLGGILERPGNPGRVPWGSSATIKWFLERPAGSLGNYVGSPGPPGNRWESAGGVLGRSLVVTGLLWTASRAFPKWLKNQRFLQYVQVSQRF